MTQERDEYSQQSVSDTPESATVRVAPCPQLPVVRLTRRVSLGARAGPVIRGIAEARVAGIAHDDRPAPPTAFGDGGHAHPGAHHVIRSIDQRLRSLSEHSGGDAGPDPWHGADYGHVRMLALVPHRGQLRVQRIEQSLELSLCIAPLGG